MKIRTDNGGNVTAFGVELPEPYTDVPDAEIPAGFGEGQWTYDGQTFARLDTPPPPTPRLVTLLEIIDLCGIPVADAIRSALVRLAETGITLPDQTHVPAWVFAASLRRMESIDGVDMRHPLTATVLAHLVAQGVITADHVATIQAPPL